MLEELHNEPNIDMAELFTGKGQVFFAIVGEPGSGKTALLRQLNWKLACKPESMLPVLQDDSTTMYWNLKEHEAALAQNPKPLLGIYVRASDLWRLTQAKRTERMMNASDLLIEAATCIFRRLIREGDTSAPFTASDEKQFVESLRALIPVSKVVLLIDSLDLISSASRPTLLATLYNFTKRDRAKQLDEPGVPLLNNEGVDVFRVIMTSRPNALYNQPIPADPVDDGSGEEETNLVFLFLDKLFSLSLKEKLFAGIVKQNQLDLQKHNVYVPSALQEDAIRTAAASAGGKIPILGPNLDEAKIQSKILRSLRSPVAIFLMAQLQERSSTTPVSVYDMFEEIVNLLKTQQGKRHRVPAGSKPSIREAREKIRDMDRLASLFGFLYQCLAPQSWSHDFSLRTEVVRLLQILLQSLPATQPIWAQLVENFTHSQPESISPLLHLAEMLWEVVTATLVDWNLCHALDTGELLFFDEQLVQFLCCRFLIDEEFSEPIIRMLRSTPAENADAADAAIGASTNVPLATSAFFSWRDASFMTHTHWNFVYDLVGTKRGPVWLAQRILPPSPNSTTPPSIFDWLASIRKNDGVDEGDLGHIRFYRLLRGFALQQEDLVLLKRRLNQPPPSANSPNSTAEEVELADLKEAFGMTFVAILEDNPSAIIHIEKAPVSSFGCFSQNAISIIIEQLVKLLRTGNIYVISDLLLNLDKNKLISDDIVAKVIDIVDNPDTEYKPLRPALRFLTQRSPPWRHMSVVVGALGARDQDTQAEAAEALERLGHASLDTWRKTLTASGLFQGHTRPPFVLFEDKDWTLLIASTVSLLVDFVDAHLLETDKSAHLFDAPHEPKCRLPQCFHLKQLVALLESDHPATRLFPYVCLGNTIRSNMYDRDAELRSISSQLIILDFMGKIYRPSESDCAGADTIHELVPLNESDNSMRCIAFILLELFGEQVAKFSVTIKDLILSKVDLLQQLSTWLLARLSPPQTLRRTLLTQVLTSNSIPPKISAIVMKDILYLSTRTDYSLQQLEAEDLDIVLQNTIFNPVPRITMMLHRAAMRFLDRSAVMSSNIDYKIAALERISTLFDRFFGAVSQPSGDALGTAQIFLELLLRILSDMLSYQNCKYKQRLMPHCERLSLRAKLLAAYRLQQQQSQAGESQIQPPSPRDKRTPMPPRSSIRLWFSKVLMGQVLSHLIPSDNADLLEMLHFLNSSEAELRALAIGALHKISSVELASKLIQRVSLMMEVEGDAFIRRSFVVLLGSLGRRADAPQIRAAAIDAAIRFMEQEKFPVRQELGVGVICTIGPVAKQVAPKIERIITNILLKLASKNSPASTTSAVSLLPEPRSLALTREEVALLVSIVECIPSVGLLSNELVSALFSLLWNAGDSALRLSILTAFRILVSSHTGAESIDFAVHESLVTTLLKGKDEFTRELTLKIVRHFGRAVVWNLRHLIGAAVSDPDAFCRKQAIKALELLVGSSDVSGAMEMLPFVAKALDDVNAAVVCEALRFFRQFKRSSTPSSSSPIVVWRLAKTKLVLPTLADMPGSANASAPGTDANTPEDSPAQSPLVQRMNAATSAATANVAADDDVEGGSNASDVSEDTFYVEQIIMPYLEKIVALLYKRRFKLALNVKLGVLLALGETTLLHPHISSFGDILNGENIANLVDFGDALRSLGPQVLQYIPPIINLIKPGSPLVRNLVRLLSRHERQLDPATCSRLFGIHTIRQMMQNKDATVRKVAVTLMAKKVIQRPRHLGILVQMWADKNNKVRKEVMEVLGDIGKNYPQFVAWIMETIDTDSVSSVLVWRFLSKSWGVLIEANPTPPTPVLPTLAPGSNMPRGPMISFGIASNPVSPTMGAMNPHHTTAPNAFASPASALPTLPQSGPSSFMD